MSHSDEIPQGSLDLLILTTVRRGGAMHGYAIARHIQQTTGDVLRVEEGSLYPALHRLEHRGLLASEWGASASNRRAKFYRLTPQGRRRLAEDTAGWLRVWGAIQKVLTVAE